MGRKSDGDFTGGFSPATAALLPGQHAAQLARQEEHACHLSDSNAFKRSQDPTMAVPGKAQNFVNPCTQVGNTTK
jgi:hypothetical protein